MKRVMKLLGISLGTLVLLVAVGVAGLYAWTGSEIKKKTTLPVHAFTAPTDAASVARGEHLLRAVAKCSDCHRPDLGGGPIIENPAMGRVYAANLTSGTGGIRNYTDADFERAVRHGQAQDGRRLLIMPSNEYQYLSDEDLGAIIAYLRTVPPTDRETPAQSVGPVARALFATGKLPLFPGEFVSHDESVVASVPVDTTVAYGKYLGDVGCAGCHGLTYGGGAIPGGDPAWPKTANLTPTGIGHYTYEGFVTALRTGVRPDGSKLDPFMPVTATSLMTDIEMKAVWNYLQTLEPKPFGAR